MRLRHKGVRPKNDIALLDFKRKIYIEEFDDGRYRLWNRRQLKSGCNMVVTNPKEMQGCLYCPICDEWFNPEQWEEVW